MRQKNILPKFDLPRNLSRMLIFSIALIISLMVSIFLTKQKSYLKTEAVSSFTFSAVGDFSKTAKTTTVLNGIHTKGDAFTLALGDFGYGTPAVDWSSWVKVILGSTYKFEIIAGNHDEPYIDTYTAQFPNKLGALSGTYGKEYYVNYPPSSPLARFIFLSPGEFSFSYAKGSGHYNWVSNAIDSARAAGIKWIIVSMHKNCYSIGTQGCTTNGVDLLNLLIEKKVDLVLQGHDHTYQRTFPLSLNTNCTSIQSSSFNSACLANITITGPYRKQAGTIIMIVGTGGTTLQNIDLTQPEAGYFAKWSGANQNPTWGFARISLSSTQLSAQFIPTSGTYSDSFSIQ